MTTPKIQIFTTFLKRDTDREKESERCFLKINTTRTNNPQTKEEGFGSPVKPKISIFPVFFNRAISDDRKTILKSMQRLQKQIGTIIKSVKCRTASQPQNLNFHWFFLRF